MQILWYNSDEVNDFHPVIERALNNALSLNGFDNMAEVIHHPSIPNSSIIPDFGIRLKSSKRWVFIIEVKRTKRDVDSLRCQNQSRSYVIEFGPHWEPNFYKYFCITNVEKLIMFADRPGPITTCILKGNPFTDSSFDPLSHDATNAENQLTNTYNLILQLIFNQTPPDWDNNWQPIIDQFYSTYNSLKSTLMFTDDINKELTLFELFRLLVYSYLKEYYTQIDSINVSYFRNFPPNTANMQQFKSNLSNNFDRIVQLDFKQIFSNHPDQNQRIFPENFDSTIYMYFKTLIHCFNSYGYNAVVDNNSPSYVFNLLTSQIYERDELHKKGKIMSDNELSLLLAELTIDSPDDNVLDPCCGDGALLDAAYDRLNYLALSSNSNKSHDDLLNQIDGIEIDPFLSQLSAFRLLSKNLAQVNTNTEVNIITNNTFSKPRPSKYNTLVMNPPFLRNDNPYAPITIRDKKMMRQAIDSTDVNYFVGDASQPNLYFYFMNYIWHYLKPNGKAGIILMSKFLNNKDGECLKQFIKDKIEALVSYPRKYFRDFAVTTVVVILKKGGNSSNVSFVRVSDESLLLTPDNLKNILAQNQDNITPSYKLKIVSRNNLNASDNWRKYLLGQNYDIFQSLDFLVEIEHHFNRISRGNAETNGASTIIFPEFDQKTNSYFGFGKRLSVQQRNMGVCRTKITISKKLHRWISYGIKNNFIQRNLILNIDDITKEKAFHFPTKSDKNTINALPENLHTDQELVAFYQSGIDEFGLKKWRKIVNSAYNNTICPRIVIPRADRTKHSVYYNPYEYKLTLSTNFFYCNDLKNQNVNISNDMQYNFIAAFLMSSFGQIQFELNANNHEGLRKLEGSHIKRFIVPDLEQLTVAEISNVVKEYCDINISNQSVTGDEGLQNNPRQNLDKALANIIFHRNSLGFSSADEMVNFYELFLADLVEDRRL